MSAESLPKRCGFITLSAWVISTSVVKMGWWVLEWDDRQNGRQHRSHNYQCGGGKTHCSLATIIMKTLLSTYDKLGLETKNSSASIFALKSWYVFAYARYLMPLNNHQRLENFVKYMQSPISLKKSWNGAHLL